MNPFPMVAAMFRRDRVALAFFLILMAFSVALGVAVTSQERAFRQGSARASDKFDLLVGAPGSQIDLVLSAVYLRVTSMELLAPDVLHELLNEPQTEWVAPLAFGDSHAGNQIVGTTMDLVAHLSPDFAEGRGFETQSEAIVGSRVPLELGEGFRAAHGGPGYEEHMHTHDLTVVGRLMPTNSPWDDAIIVPVEHSWESHGLPTGHAPENAFGNRGTPQDLGPPFDPEYLPGVPAVVVKPSNVAAAYGLRQKYRSDRSQALFPAEILVQLFALLGDARGIMNAIALATQALVVAAVLSGLMIVLQLHRKNLAILRALGATRTYVVGVAWTFLISLVAVAAILGTFIGVGAAQVVSTYLAEVSGISMSASLTFAEISMVIGLLAAASVLALIPSIYLFNRPVGDALRD